MRSGLIALIALNCHSPLLISGSECVWSWGRILVIHTYLNVNEIGMDHWIWKIPSTWWHHCIWRILCVGFLCSSEDNESASNSRDLGLIARSGRFPEEGNVNKLQYFCLENSMDRGAWQATVHEIVELDMIKHACRILGRKSFTRK